MQGMFCLWSVLILCDVDQCFGRTRASILVWKLYIEHEIRCKNMDRAKSLYYRAIRACPWSKGEFDRKLRHSFADDEYTLHRTLFVGHSCIVKAAV